MRGELRRSSADSRSVAGRLPGSEAGSSGCYVAFFQSTAQDLTTCNRGLAVVPTQPAEYDCLHPYNDRPPFPGEASHKLPYPAVEAEHRGKLKIVIAVEALILQHARVFPV